MRDAAGNVLTPQSLPAYNKVLFGIVRTIFDRNVAAGKRDPLEFCLIFRTKPRHHVWPRIPGGTVGHPDTDRAYATPGNLTHVEAAVDGRWRIATIAEEAVCRKQDADDCLAARAVATTANHAKLMQELDKAVAEAFKNA